MSTKPSQPTQPPRPSPGKVAAFTSYERFVVTLLAVIQFTVVLDFMVLSPLGAILLEELHITTAQFGRVVSAYAFSAGISGFLAATFADRFDRKRLLLIFYAGFMIGTWMCGLAPNYHALLIARIVTGVFGGVLGSISFAIITDLFPLERRGRVMGFVQMAFAASQVLGIPFGVYLANHWGWHAPFFLIVALCGLTAAVLAIRLQPVTAHLELRARESPIAQLGRSLANPRYLRGFVATTLLASGGFMLMPFGSTFAVNNLGITMEQLPVVYLATGICTLFAGPLIGRLADKTGKFKIFIAGSLVSMIITVIYTHLGVIPIWFAIALNVVLFVGITGRIIASSALISAVPEPRDRGMFMSINSSVQQASGGIAAMIAGLIVVQLPSGKLARYDVLGFVVAGLMLITIFLVQRIDQMIHAETTNSSAPAPH